MRPEVEVVYRTKDRSVCGYFIRGAVSAVEFVEAFKEQVPDVAVPAFSAIYCEYWRILPRNGGTVFQRCRDDAPGAFAVTGYDVSKWRR